MDCGRRQTSQAGSFAAHAVEESDGERGAASAVVVGRRTGERSKEAVQGAPGDRGGLPQQFVEHGVCVLRAERPGADALRGQRKGIVGRLGTWGRRGGGGGGAATEGAEARHGRGGAVAEADSDHWRGGGEGVAEVEEEAEADPGNWRGGG
jgi:hypothetical protein